MRTSNIQHRTSSIIHSPSSLVAPLPAPRGGAIGVRVATMDDLPFLDAMQTVHNKALGYFPTQQFQGYIEMGAVLIAQEGSGFRVQGSGNARTTDGAPDSSSLNPEPRTLNPLGYCISRDRYLKRDELGVIFQLCVAPGHQRGLIGATLVREVFERSAYGCRLYCCWCAQDLAANYFWESLGFVPLAFRGGSGKKKRVHIFWQKRIRAGDETTPWWFPAKTDQGAMRADRLVLPIPPGVRWSDPMPVLAGGEVRDQKSEVRSLKKPRAGLTSDLRSLTSGPLEPTPRSRAGVQFGPPSAKTEVAKPAKPTRAKASGEKVKCDPKLIAAARELRDRWMEEVNSGRFLLESQGKYDVSRRLEEVQNAECGVQNGRPALPPQLVKQLPAAA